MTPAELAARCLIRVRMRTLPVDVRLMITLTRGTYLYTADRAFRAGARLEALAAVNAMTPAATFEPQEIGGPDRRAVVYLPDADPVRLRFTLAHELGHIALKHGRHPARSMERDADEFALRLLMPPPVARALEAAQGVLYAEQLCAVFGIGLRQAMTYGEMPSLPPEEEAALCELLLPAAMARIPPRVPPTWHRVSAAPSPLPPFPAGRGETKES